MRTIPSLDGVSTICCSWPGTGQFKETNLPIFLLLKIPTLVCNVEVWCCKTHSRMSCTQCLFGSTVKYSWHSAQKKSMIPNDAVELGSCYLKVLATAYLKIVWLQCFKHQPDSQWCCRTRQLFFIKLLASAYLKIVWLTAVFQRSIEKSPVNGDNVGFLPQCQRWNLWWRALLATLY